MKALRQKGRARKSLPSPNGGIQQPQNGICLHESKTPNLSKHE